MRLVNVIKLKVLRTFWEDPKHPNARPPLQEWFKHGRQAQWRSFAEARATYAHADQVRLDCGVVVTIFNVGGNKYRIVTLIDYFYQKVRITHVLTHKDYDRGFWKRQVCEGSYANAPRSGQEPL